MSITDTLLLATHLNQPPIVPATAGWDARINDYLEYLRFDTFKGLLARTCNLAPITTSAGSVILTVPAGYSAYVTDIIVKRRGTTPITSTFTIGTEATTPDNWNNAPVSFASLTSDAFPLMVRPYVSGEVLGNAPKVLPIIDGDGATPTLKIQRTGGSSVALDFFVFGTVWRN